MESLEDHSYSGIDDGIKVHCFLQGFKGTELVTAVNVVQTQQKYYDKDFNMTVSYLDQMVTKKGYNMQSIHIVKTGSLSANL